MIQASGLVKKYGNRTVVNGLDLTIEKGEVLAIIGPNGAGKSTTLDLLLSLKKLDKGSISYWCKDPAQHIGVQLQSTPFFQDSRRLRICECSLLSMVCVHRTQNSIRY